MTRIPFPLVFVCLLAACSESGPAAPTPPPSNPAPAPAPEPQPPPPPPPVPPGQLVVSGTVVEHTLAGPRPLPGLRLSVVWSAPPWDWWGYAPPSTTEVTSDGNGQYSVALAPGSFFGVFLESTEFRAPCPAGFEAVHDNATMDIHVVSTAVLASTGAPASMPTTAFKVSGRVIEKEPNKGQPVAGASVGLFAPLGPESGTLTDSGGRFLLCTSPPGTGNGQSMFLSAHKDGYLAASRTVVVGRDNNVVIELDGHEGATTSVARQAARHRP